MPRVHVPDEHQHDPSAYVWTAYAPEIGAAAANYSRTVYERSTLSLREMEAARIRTADINGRSEEHTSELQSLMRISYAVFCLKKKKKHSQHSFYLILRTNYISRQE